MGNLKYILNKLLLTFEENFKIFEKMSELLLVKFNSISR